MFQELQTGFISGLGDYLYRNAPYAVEMKPAQYDDYYRSSLVHSRSGILMLVRPAVLCYKDTAYGKALDGIQAALTDSFRAKNASTLLSCDFKA